MAAYTLAVPGGAPPINLPEPCISRACHPLTGCVDGTSSSAGDGVEQQWVAACHDTTDSWTRGAVWRGGELLAREILTRPYLVRGLRVVECGAGTGIAGLAAAAAGAATVTLTDRSLDAAEAALHVNPTLTDRVSLRTLEWGDTASAAALAPPYDVVLAADVIHPQNAEALGSLLDSMRALSAGNGSSAPGSRFPSFALLSYVERSAQLTHQLERSLRALPARCRRRTLARGHAWLYELDRWDDWPSGRECADDDEAAHMEAHATEDSSSTPRAAASPSSGGASKPPKRLVPGFRRSFNSAND